MTQARTLAKLRRAELLLELQKRVAGLLGIPLQKAPNDVSD